MIILQLNSPAVPLSIPLVAAASGLFQYPAAGTLVEISFADG
ncbi:hypothetical protein [Photorhabdus khanii]|nr:hypothetical protein [Photorhabdus khanii]